MHSLLGLRVGRFCGSRTATRFFSNGYRGSGRLSGSGYGGNYQQQQQQQQQEQPSFVNEVDGEDMDVASEKPSFVAKSFGGNTNKYPSSSSSSSSSVTGSYPYSKSKNESNEVVIMAFAGEENQDFTLEAFTNASTEPFPAEVTEALSEPLSEDLIEIKPDGSVYLPEVHYRRLLNKAFGLGGWTLLPRGPHSLQSSVISREYALFAHGKFIAQARGHATITGNFQSPAMCTEAVKSNALMRCCKDLGVASVLWESGVMAGWKAKFAMRKQVTDSQGRVKYLWEKKKSHE